MTYSSHPSSYGPQHNADARHIHSHMKRALNGVEGAEVSRRLDSFMREVAIKSELGTVDDRLQIMESAYSAHQRYARSRNRRSNGAAYDESGFEDSFQRHTRDLIGKKAERIKELSDLIAQNEESIREARPSKNGQFAVFVEEKSAQSNAYIEEAKEHLSEIYSFSQRYRMNDEATQEIISAAAQHTLNSYAEIARGIAGHVAANSEEINNSRLFKQGDLTTIISDKSAQNNAYLREADALVRQMYSFSQDRGMDSAESQEVIDTAVNSVLQAYAADVQTRAASSSFSGVAQYKRALKLAQIAEGVHSESLQKAGVALVRGASSVIAHSVKTNGLEDSYAQLVELVDHAEAAGYNLRSKTLTRVALQNASDRIVQVYTDELTTLTQTIDSPVLGNLSDLGGELAINSDAFPILAQAEQTLSRGMKFVATSYASHGAASAFEDAYIGLLAQVGKAQAESEQFFQPFASRFMDYAHSIAEKFAVAQHRMVSDDEIQVTSKGGPLRLTPESKNSLKSYKVAVGILEGRRERAKDLLESVAQSENVVSDTLREQFHLLKTAYDCTFNFGRNNMLDSDFKDHKAAFSESIFEMYMTFGEAAARKGDLDLAIETYKHGFLFAHQSNVRLDPDKISELGGYTLEDTIGDLADNKLRQLLDLHFDSEPQDYRGFIEATLQKGAAAGMSTSAFSPYFSEALKERAIARITIEDSSIENFTREFSEATELYQLSTSLAVNHLYEAELAEFKTEFSTELAKRCVELGHHEMGHFDWYSEIEDLEIPFKVHEVVSNFIESPLSQLGTSDAFDILHPLETSIAEKTLGALRQHIENGDDYKGFLDQLVGKASDLDIPTNHFLDHQQLAREHADAEVKDAFDKLMAIKNMQL